MLGGDRQTNAYNLRKLADQDLIRLVKNTRLEIQSSFGKIKADKATQGKLVAVVDPHNNFRRKLIARCLTILTERGIKDDSL